MRKILIILLLIPFFALTQTEEKLDFISTLHDGVAAVMKNNSWGFINDEGDLIIPYRNDLVLTETDGYKYPIFKNNRCLISKEKEGITYFGYIDKTGNTVIEPIFLNASNFNNNTAIALGLIKTEIGNNDLLGKNVVNYRYFEVTIDINGNVKNYLNPKGINIVLDKMFLIKPPEITSKRISDSLYAVLDENKKWTVVAINK